MEAAVTVIGSRSLFRAGLVSLLSTIGFEPIGEADDIKQLKQCTHPPGDTLIVGLARGIGDMVEAAGEIKAWSANVKIVFLVAELDLEMMSACFAAGASGYLLESISRDALRESLKLVNAGEKVFPSELAALFPALTSKSSPLEGIAPMAETSEALSRREVEILQCLASGQSNKVIAKNLDITEATVKVHVKRILRKAHVLNRTQAALWGVATGVALAPVHKAAS